MNNAERERLAIIRLQRDPQAWVEVQETTNPAENIRSATALRLFERGLVELAYKGTTNYPSHVRLK